MTRSIACAHVSSAPEAAGNLALTAGSVRPARGAGDGDVGRVISSRTVKSAPARLRRGRETGRRARPVSAGAARYFAGAGAFVAAALTGAGFFGIQNAGSAARTSFGT